MKPYILLLALAVEFISCTPPKEKETNTQVSQQEKNVELVHQYYAFFNNHEWEKMAEMYVDTAEFKDPSLGPGIVKQTREETIAKYTELNSIFPDLHDEVANIYPSGENHVIVEFVSSGTGPDSSTFELPICTIFTFENGQITKDYTYFDNFDETE